MSSPGRIRFVGILLTPSIASAILCFTLSFFIMFVSSLAYNSQTGVLYRLLFGSDSSSSLIETAQNSLDSILQNTFGNSVFNKIVFFAFWCFIGLLVYLFLSGIGKTTSTISEKISDTSERMHYLHAKKLQFEEQIGLRLIIYSISLIFGFLFFIFFARLLLPFAILCGRVGLTNLSTFSGWIYLLEGLFVLSVGLHVFVVVLRFLLLRPRVFGNGADLLDSELSHEQHESFY